MWIIGVQSRLTNSDIKWTAYYLFPFFRFPFFLGRTFSLIITSGSSSDLLAAWPCLLPAGVSSCPTSKTSECNFDLWRSILGLDKNILSHTGHGVSVGKCISSMWVRRCVLLAMVLPQNRQRVPVSPFSSPKSKGSSSFISAVMEEDATVLENCWHHVKGYGYDFWV